MPEQTLKQIAVYVDPDLNKKIEAAAKKERRTISGLIKTILDKYFKGE